MQPNQFRHLLGRLEALTPAQIEAASTRITDLRRRREAIAEIEARAEGAHECPHCGHGDRQKWGRTRTGIQRYRCSGCKRTRTGRTGTDIGGIHRPDLFLEVVKNMMGDRNPSSIRELARELGLNKHTVWRWRILACAALAGSSSNHFSGIVEADETYQRESRKGSREWVRYLRDPLNNPRPPRRRWYEYEKLGIPMLRGLSRWQLPIMSVADRSGARLMQRIPDRTFASFANALEPLVEHDVMLCTDGHTHYARFARENWIKHLVVPADARRRSETLTHHISRINALHARYDAFIRLFRGPATKYLDGYLDWFAARILKISPTRAYRAACGLAIPADRPEFRKCKVVSLSRLGVPVS